MTMRTHRRPRRRPLTDRLAVALAFGSFAGGPAFVDIARQLVRSLARCTRRGGRDLRPA